MAQFKVSSVSELYDALDSASGGDTILLRPGTYDSISLTPKQAFDIEFSSSVTIKSLDPDNPAVITGLEVDGAKNITFDNLLFESDYAGDQVFYGSFYINNSSGITIEDSVFTGQITTSGAAERIGYATGKGLTISGCTDVTIENNEFTTWNKAALFFENTDLIVKGNDIHDISSDGMDFAHNSSLLIEDNYIHDFVVAKDSGDHVDLIQFWTTGGTTPTTDVIIRGNTLDIGDGDVGQALFMRNEVVDQGLAGEEMFYQNILIEDNIILNSHIHGITVGEVDGLVIRNNSVLSLSPSDERYSLTPQVIVAETSKNVTIESNVLHAVSGDTGKSDWSVDQNVFVQNSDPDAPGYYASMFFESSIEGRDGFSGYVVVPGSTADGLTAGASGLILDTTPATVTPHFDVSSATGPLQALVFDATHTYGPTGQITSDDATFIWDFGDGTTATGRVVEHSYDTAGRYDVTLKVLADGQDEATTATAVSGITIAGDSVLSFNSDDGTFYAQGYGTQTVIDDSDGASTTTNKGQVIDLGGTGTKLEIPPESFSRFFGTDTFEMSMTLQADQAGTSWGEVVRIHSSMIVTVEENGDMQVLVFLDTGSVSLTSQGVAVNDGSAHNISIQLDGATNSLQLIIDGEVTASETTDGSMPGIGSWGLAFGEPWGGQNFDGKLSAFNLDASFEDYPTFEGDTDFDEGALPVLDDFVTDFAQLNDKQLRDDAYVEVTGENNTLHLDGESDFARLGKLTQFSESDQLSIAVTYNKSELSSEEQRLVWKNKDIGLSVEGDSLKVYIAQEDTRFQQAIEIDGLGLNDTENHQVIVMIDAATDHLQVILDGALVLDMQQDSNIIFSSNEIDRTWKIGGTQKSALDGEISDFRIDASAEFLAESLLVPDDASLIA